MNAPRATTLSDGGIRLEELAPWFVSALLELPALLAPRQNGSVDRRLCPDPTVDNDLNEDWERFVRPELFALLASSREIVLRDLGSLQAADPETPIGPWTLTIPGEHLKAWMSALNAARLTIAELFRISEEDMREGDDGEDDPWLEDAQDEGKEPASSARTGHRRERESRRIKQMAVAQIHILGWIQQLLVEEHWPSPTPLDDREREGEDPA